jgi:hypothetical protein
MPSLAFPTYFGGVAVTQVPSVGSSPVQPGALVGKLRLPTDPIGTHTLTLSNVVVGSRIHIRDQADTTTLYDQVADATTEVIALNVYAAGSTLNNWRIRIRKASSGTTYRPYETLMTATVGSSSIYVSQIADE